MILSMKTPDVYTVVCLTGKILLKQVLTHTSMDTDLLKTSFNILALVF